MRVDEVPVSSPTLSSSPPTDLSSSGRILIVEDDPQLARGLVRVLTNLGYDAEAFGDAASAIAALSRTAFDVVLSDIELPDMSGVDLLRVVREHDLDVPVILVTGHPSVDTAVRAVELGALQYITKPAAVDVIQKAVERAVKLHRIARAKRDALELLGESRNTAGDLAGLTASFDRALASLFPVFQPIVDCGLHVAGYEALLRTREPALPHPGAVLSAAERLGRLPDLGRRMRNLTAEAFACAAPGTLLFVNLHTRDLLDSELYEKDAPLSAIASRVILEITERSRLDEVEDVRARVKTLRELGFGIAIDDLGAGYAGLTSFATLEPEVVKLDMSLVQGIDASPVRQRLVASMAALCKEMGMRVVAEGIETPAEHRTVRALGCDLFQGYLFARPGPAFPVVSVTEGDATQ